MSSNCRMDSMGLHQTVGPSPQTWTLEPASSFLAFSVKNVILQFHNFTSKMLICTESVLYQMILDSRVGYYTFLTYNSIYLFIEE